MHDMLAELSYTSSISDPKSDHPHVMQLVFVETAYIESGEISMR
jgi:hypothetical protein